MSYIKDNFLLTNKTAEKLYFDYASKMPIFDYHCHLPEKQLLENAEFSDCDYYILIFSSLEAKSYYENAKLDQLVTINGDITSGKCSIKFN